MDKEFDWLCKKLGSPTKHADASAAQIDAYRGRLPDRLLGYWQRYGFCSFDGGLFSIVDPALYEDDMVAWIGDTKIVEQDAYHVVARSGFGALYLWGTKTGYRYEIDASRGWIIVHDGDQADIAAGGADEALGRFFALRKKAHFDIEGASGEGLFHAATKSLGFLERDEVFAFEPSLMLGGAPALEHIVKRNVHVHLAVLAQLGYREVLDRQALAKKAFG